MIIPKNKILVLGASGMLGSMVFDHLSKDKKFEVRGTVRNSELVGGKLKDWKPSIFEAGKDDLNKLFSDFKPDYVINCIGIIKPYCKDGDEEGVARAIKINALFPHELSSICGDLDIRVIQIATDCVYSGKKGNYLETDLHDALDVYGKTKSLGEAIGKGFLNIRSSIIGPELHNKNSLLEWFFSKKRGEKVDGYTHHIWNGVTTLQFAEVCDKLIFSGKDLFDEMVERSPVVHLILNKTVNKCELLEIFNKVFDRGLIINPVNNIGEPVDRSISTKYDYFKGDSLLEMVEAVKKLKQYMESSKMW